MMEWMRQWLLGIVAAALLTALAESLISQKSMRYVARLIGGILMLTAFLRPLGQLSPGRLDASFEEYKTQVEAMTKQYRTEQNKTYSAIIEEELAAYIVDKAAEMGIETEARVAVEMGEDAVLRRKEVHLTVPKTSELERWLEEELEIPSQAQYWQEE